jgi:transcriptional regulator with XRE-family HTH domain
MATDLGIFLKTLMLKKNITQEGFARVAGCSPSQLSLILNGRKTPDFGFLSKCGEYFALDEEGVIELFRNALSSSREIILDTSYFNAKMKGVLIDILVPLLLSPEIPYMDGDELEFDKALRTINDTLKRRGRLNPMRKDCEKKNDSVK